MRMGLLNEHLDEYRAFLWSGSRMRFLRDNGDASGDLWLAGAELCTYPAALRSNRFDRYAACRGDLG